MAMGLGTHCLCQLEPFDGRNASCGHAMTVLCEQKKRKVRFFCFVAVAKWIFTKKQHILEPLLSTPHVQKHVHIQKNAETNLPNGIGHIFAQNG